MSERGAYNENNGEYLQGTYLEVESKEHINFLELNANLISLSKFCKDTVNSDVNLLIENTLAVKYISKVGGKIANFNNLTGSIWPFC